MNTETALAAMLSGKMPADEMAKYLTDLADRGETVEDIVGGAKALRKHVSGIIARSDAIDCCGTGGDMQNTLNISTAVALVLAACDVPVAKHGNKSSSGGCGAADVLAALDVPLDVSYDRLEEALEKFCFCFLMAPFHHRAMANVAAVRKSLGRRTIFNLLGPLSNPANVRRQMVGVYSQKWVRPMAEALKILGCKGAWVVFGDGMDEITLSGPTHVAVLDDKGNISEKILQPEDFGLPRCTPEDIKGGNIDFNAAALRDLLEGEHSAYRNTVLANAAAALVMTGDAKTLQDGVKKAGDVLDGRLPLDILFDYKEHCSD